MKQKNWDRQFATLLLTVAGRLISEKRISHRQHQPRLPGMESQPNKRLHATAKSAARELES
jgi:hypothetical protein